MGDCPNDKAPLLNEANPMHIIKDGPTFKATKRAEAESRAYRATKSGSGGRKRGREPPEPEDELGSQSRSVKRIAVESRAERSWYPWPGRSRERPQWKQTTISNENPSRDNLREEGPGPNLAGQVLCRGDAIDVSGARVEHPHRRYVLIFDLETCSHCHR